MIEFWFAALLFIFVFVAYWYLSVPANLPPGSVGLPVIGSIFEYGVHGGTRQLRIIQENVTKYGRLYKLYVLNKLIVVLGDYDTIQEAFIRQADVFAGRPQFLRSFVPKALRHRGITFSEGDLWKEQRRFALSTLRDFGVGRPILEPRIKEEAEYLIERLAEYASSGEPFDPRIPITFAATNVICQLVFGKRFDYDDQEAARIFHRLVNQVATIGPLSPFTHSDVALWCLKFLPSVRRALREGEEFSDFVHHQMKNTMDSFDPASEPTNFVHAFMKAAAAVDNAEEGKSSFSVEQLFVVVTNLFTAGTLTTSATIAWAILLLARDQGVQEKVYEELKEETGLFAIPDYADRGRLPFTEAAIAEVQRIGNLLPYGFLRRTVEPTKLFGYDIPEGATVIPFLQNVLHDPRTFPNPERFDPTRFLDGRGKFKKDPKLIPFQSGKRVCLGEALARMELFLFITALFGRYRFVVHGDLPNLEFDTGMFRTPKPYKIWIERRNE